MLLQMAQPWKHWSHDLSFARDIIYSMSNGDPKIALEDTDDIIIQTAEQTERQV